MEKLLYLEIIKHNKRNLKKAKKLNNAWDALGLCIKHGVDMIKLHKEYKYQKN